MSVRILIVDDEAPARIRMSALLDDIALDCPHQVVGSVANAQAALSCVKSVAVDIVLLDVQMPGTSGIALAEQLGHLDRPPAVIFVTAFDAYAISAFEVQAVDYLLKPVRASRLVAAIRRVIDGRLSGVMSVDTPAPPIISERRYFSVHERGRILLVPVTEVIYLKAEQKYVTLRTRTREYLLEESLLSIEVEYGDFFVRVHRNTIVARNAVVGVERMNTNALAASQTTVTHEGTERSTEGWQVLLRGVDERMPISRRQWSTVKALVK
jgi:two-component system response regulator AlgR